MAKIFIISGVILVLVGVAWPVLQKIGLGHLPGDIHIKKEGFSFHFPLMTSILVSLVLSGLAWLWNRFSR
jgi:hypothetical protein